MTYFSEIHPKKIGLCSVMEKVILHFGVVASINKEREFARKEVKWLKRQEEKQWRSARASRILTPRRMFLSVFTAPSTTMLEERKFFCRDCRESLYAKRSCQTKGHIRWRKKWISMQRNGRKKATTKAASRLDILNGEFLTPFNLRPECSATLAPGCISE